MKDTQFRIRVTPKVEQMLKASHMNLPAPAPRFNDFANFILSCGLSHYRTEILQSSPLHGQAPKTTTAKAKARA